MNLDAPLHTYIPSISRELARAEAREHAYRPALKALLEALKPGFQAINEPAHIDVGAPDFIVLDGQTPIGFVEAKDIGEDLRRVERSEQLRRYLSALPNLILTDYVEFRWYVKGEHRETARLGEVRERKLRTTREEVAAVASLLSGFALETTPTILTAAELATRMAAMTREIRRLIEHSLDSSASLQSQKAAFEHTLLPNLAAEQFADLYAQTIAYGLFAARVRFAGEPEKFTLHRAFWDLPETNPFLRGMFQQLALDFDSRVAWLVDALAALLARADTDEILRDFGRSTRQEDPVVHFYETFLSIYDPVLRERRGVYYTPEPVVDYIVRSVDILLQTHFNRPAGLADAHTLILDPATGTGTFLYFVIQHIYETLRAQGQLGAWDHYVGAHLLPRLFGFELLVAPYAVAHMKLGIALQDLGYTFRSGQRLGIYLTNTLEAEIRPEETPLGLAGIISQEASAAESVKREKPIMVVLGNPPYSGHSSNRGDWISGLIRDYYFVDGQPLGERNPKWLQDDYVKFIRFGQWRIAQTGEGVLAFITNHGYLDNPTFRGMRQQLMAAFSDIYILNLHGNSKKKEVAPDGSPDQNVFDIQQGVAIGLFVKRGSETPPRSPSPQAGRGLGAGFTRPRALRRPVGRPPGQIRMAPGARPDGHALAGDRAGRAVLSVRAAGRGLEGGV
ncbi:MAG: N-6 DNA methylase [Anaerolineae bacterium]|nr:N-6 DNA methylase [Anaerolineae bacterium]